MKTTVKIPKGTAFHYRDANTLFSDEMREEYMRYEKSLHVYFVEKDILIDVDMEEVKERYNKEFASRVDAARKEQEELYNETPEKCPSCGSSLEVKSSGVRCTKCDYWFCF